MRTLRAAVVILIFTCSCFGQKKPCSSKYEYLTYSFKIDNQDSAKMGFTFFADDESYGVKAVAIYPGSKYVYVIDASHGNLKRIDIANGQTISSRKVNIKYKGLLLYDIAVMQNKVYVTSDRGVFIFDTNLNYIGNIESDSVWTNLTGFSRVTNDSLFIAIRGTQLKDLSIEESQLVITKDSNFLRKKIIPIKELTEERKIRRILGKEYQTNMSGGKPFLQNEFGCYELKSSIPNISKYYSSRNIDFDKRTIVYFDSTPEQLNLYCYLLD